MATALPLPNLDDRRWVDLVDEARALIPFYAPGWTDHNVHDPGISVLELFAWIAELDLYAVNQITDAHRRKFLALAGVTPEPPRPAETILGLRLAPGPPPRPLPAGTEFEGRDPFGTPVRFRATHDLTVQPGGLAAVLTGDGQPGAQLRNVTTGWLRGEPIQPFGPDPRPGAALYLGFDLPAPWAGGTVLSLGVAPAEPDGRSGLLQHHSVRLLWEIRTGPGRWTRLAPEDVADGTRALTLDGRVVLRVPGPVPSATLGGRPGPLAWLRARLVRGSYDGPPVLRGLTDNAAHVVQAVPAVASLRLAPNAAVTGVPPAPGTMTGLDLHIDRQGEVDRLGFTPVTEDRPAVRLLAFDPAQRSLIIEAAAASRGTGGPGQRVEITGAPVVAASLRVSSLENGTWRAWSLRADFDASTRSDAHLVLDPTAGTVRFGDGEHGRTAPQNSTLLLTADLTSAAGGNLAAGAVDRLADSPRNRAVLPDLAVLATQLTIGNVVAAAGGTAAETIPAAIARAREGREQAMRAVTLEDYETLARQTPGVRLARAEARANAHPGFPCQAAPGVVLVLILPHLPADRPVPSIGLRQAVAAHLNRRRVIGTRVEVAGPRYVAVTVRATVEAVAGTPGADLAIAIRDALDRFLHPLTGGPDGTGWPFGRDVYRSEVLAVIDEVPGVAHVLALELVSADGPASCANLCLGPTGLPEAGPHEIEVR